MKKLDLSLYNGATDAPDARDYTREEFYGETGTTATLPSRVMLEHAPNLSQGPTGACTVFGSTNAYNETYAQESLKAQALYSQPFDPWLVWDEAKKRGASDTNGWIFQGALQLLKDMGCIGAYIRIGLARQANVDILRSVIAGGKAIATGVATADWGEASRTGEYRKSTKRGGHIFDMTGYDDNHRMSDGRVGAFYVENSWGGIGRFWISYEDIDVLYSQYEFALTTELQKILEIRGKRKNVNLQKAYDAKIWNEERPSDIASALEIRVMVNRALGVRDDYEWLRKMAFYLVNDKIVRDKVLMIYNEKDPWRMATDNELAIMFTRGVMRSTGINELTLSREQVAEIVGRDFL